MALKGNPVVHPGRAAAKKRKKKRKGEMAGQKAYNKNMARAHSCVADSNTFSVDKSPQPPSSVTAPVKKRKRPPPLAVHTHHQVSSALFRPTICCSTTILTYRYTTPSFG